MKDTTVGRALLWDIVPKGLPFELVNKAMKKKAISRMVNACYRRSASRTPSCLPTS